MVERKSAEGTRRKGFAAETDMDSDDATLGAETEDDSPIIKESPRNAALRGEGSFNDFLSRTAIGSKRQPALTQVSPVSSSSGQASQTGKKAKLSQSQAQAGIGGFRLALAKLPLICTKPSSLSHMSVADMRTLIMSKNFECSRLSKEDLRAKLFTLLQAGSFATAISSLHADLAVSHNRQTAGTKDTSTAPSGFLRLDDESMWEDMDAPLFDEAPDVESRAWVPVEETVVDLLESGNKQYFYSKVLRRYKKSREQRLEQGKSVVTMSPVVTGSSEESTSLVIEVSAALHRKVEASGGSWRGSAASSPEEKEGENSGALYPEAAFVQAPSSFRSLHLVQFTTPRLGLVLQRRGANSVVVRNKTDAIDPEVARHVSLGDEIVFVSPGGDLGELDYEGRLAAITIGARPLWLGLVSDRG